MNVLVTGGAGYIGSHAVAQLINAQHQVVVIDNLGQGVREAVRPAATFYELDIAETDRVAQILTQHGIDCVMHFAAFANVADSVSDPLSYYRNNTNGTISLLTAMQSAGTHKLVFSSTCATYGEPETIPITEETFQNPINPYGWSKLFVERILRDLSASDPQFGFIALRYFNVAGCALDGTLGENHNPETHLIPLVLQTANGTRESISIYGIDYPTQDGTCIRDYVHVDDLCRAHLLAMDAITAGTERFYNVGIGRGYSVREIIDAVQRVSGQPINAIPAPRRPGDPPILYADGSKIAVELGWQPEIVEINQIVSSAWNWFS